MTFRARYGFVCSFFSVLSYSFRCGLACLHTLSLAPFFLFFSFFTYLPLFLPLFCFPPFLIRLLWLTDIQGVVGLRKKDSGPPFLSSFFFYPGWLRSGGQKLKEDYGCRTQGEFMIGGHVHHRLRL